MRKIFLFLFCCFLFFNELESAGIHYGLTFYSHTVNQDVRTSLNLTPKESFSFPNGFSLAFNIKFNPGIQTYGYVCRITSGNNSLDIISNINASKLNFVLIDVDMALANVEFKISLPQNKDDWSKMKIDFREDKIVCSINDNVRTIPYPFSNYNDVKVNFGRNWTEMFYSSDVPPISIKDVAIRNDRSELLYFWKLDKYVGMKVYDEIYKREAIVENGSWDIDQYIKWEKVVSIPVVEKYAQIAFDSIHYRLFIATTDSLVSLNMNNLHVERSKNKKGSPFGAGGSSQMIYDCINDRLISYSLLYPDFIFYNFKTNEWSGNKLDQRFAPAHHHNRFIDIEKQRLVTFGGYGYQSYKAWLSTHPLDNGIWDIKNLSKYIAPRYLSALGYLGEGKFLLLGGYGSLSGKQEESPKNFYDLYEINSREQTCVKLFDLTFPQIPVAFSNSMIVDQDKIFALAYDNNRFHSLLNLYEIDRFDGSVSVIADSIPYNFLDMESFCDLILDKEKSILYAILMQKSNSENYNVDIYSLSYPPLQVTEVIQKSGLEKNAINRLGLMFLLLLLLVVLVIVFCCLKRKRKKNVLIEDVFVCSDNKVKTSVLELASPVSTVKLLGGFQVFDKKGEDVTDSFTPIVKQIFLYLLLSTVKDGKKITSEKLDETFWFEMDRASASNNRSVNIRKLRLLLEKIGDINVVNKTSYWFVEMGEAIICDYKDVMILLKKAKKDKMINVDLINTIIDLASSGILLPNMNAEWADGYKSEYSALLMEFLMKSVSMPEVKSNLNLQVKIANIMLLHDNVDEEAVRIKCRALFLLGQKGASKQCFNKFVQDYLRLLDTDPKINYEDIIAE